ncbi:MAG TPA: hypothetical protein K8W01_00430 [Methylorubrum populi]|uniref:Uncharacterized protein n=1 Tax=Methylorubrum populi TaxID=223967 RepID=A0A921DYX8_9HYPH|nr:hypothetical protein [Methylorubrum populi]
MAAADHSPLSAIRDALAEIIAEAPEAEPAYPKDGSRKQVEAWAYDTARWNSAQTALPALAAVNIAATAMNRASDALKAVRAACRDPDTDTALPSAVAELVDAALVAMGERS